MKRLLHAIIALTLSSTLALAQGTATKVQGVGTPGSPSGGLVSIQGVVGGTPVPISGITSSVGVTDSTGSDSSGTFTNATQTTSVSATLESGSTAYSTVTLTISGTYATATAIFEKTDDDTLTNWFPVQCSQEGQGVIETGYSALTNTNRMWQCNTQGANAFRVRSTAVASGTVNVLISPSGMPTVNGATIAISPSIDTSTMGTLTIQDAGSSTTTGQNNATIVTGTATAGSTLSVSMNGRASVTSLVSGTWVGVIAFEGSTDSGVTWSTVSGHIRGGATSIGSITGNGQFIGNTVGLTNYRVRFTTKTSGTPNIQLTTSAEAGVVYVANAIGVLGADGATKASTANPVPTNSPIPASVVVGQTKIAVTGTAVQLGSNTLVNGIVIKGKSTNNATCGTVGGASVTNTVDGTGNGYIVCPGEASSFATNNSNVVYVNGTAGDIFTFEGN